MPNLTKDSIVVGAATLVELASVDIGGTKGAATYYKEDTLVDKVGDQVKGNLDRVLSHRRCGVRAELLETTVVNMHKALNLAAAQLFGGSSSISLTDSEAVLAQLKITGPAPQGLIRTLIFDSVRQVGNFEAMFSKTDETSFPVDFEAMWNPTNNRFGTIGN